MSQGRPETPVSERRRDAMARRLEEHYGYKFPDGGPGWARFVVDDVLDAGALDLRCSACGVTESCVHDCTMAPDGEHIFAVLDPMPFGEQSQPLRG